MVPDGLPFSYFSCNIGDMRTTTKPRRKTTAERKAEEDAEIEAWIEKTVSDFGPLSDEQLDKVCAILGLSGSARVEDPEVARKRAEAEARAAAEKRFAESLTECDACNIPLAQHGHAARNSSIGFHEWVSGRAEKIMGAR